MTNESVTKILQERFANVITLDDVKTNIPTAKVDREKLVETCAQLKADPDLKFDYLLFVSGADYPPDRIDLLYLLTNFDTGHKLVLKTSIPREQPELDSVTSVWPGANWHEREAFDLFGITFHGHPDLRRIFCDGVTEGHPLRKDFTDVDFVKMPEPTVILPAPAPRATVQAAKTKPQTSPQPKAPSNAAPQSQQTTASKPSPNNEAAS